MIPEAEDVQAARLQIDSATAIAIFIMLAAIKLHGQCGFHAQKIDDEWIDRCLTTKFESVQLAVAQYAP